ncbi:patatin-like phospholipase family protein [Ramlibacter pinisoli]|uniref:patatin-like phospholipase family protein n=1 Tax=Ramlibacter pinisoli TaxID=2682844 RepID=UPI0018DFC553|nr:patatin-like phospholipase family protein [Ramlibacter pinisoli]
MRPDRLLRGATRALAFALALGCAEHTAVAADGAPAGGPKRPRIGLVLGGGGAKGAAHIGVIKALEQLRIPVDCIAGTSMGSIVGAAYATGMSARELEGAITEIDWRDVLRSAPREEVPFRRKELDAVFTNGLELGIKDGNVVFPGGLVPTHRIESVFRRIVAAAGSSADFNRLPIPFRSVATDLETGEMVLFDHGDLAVAMRASMAVPGAFAPVEHEGRLLVDGMLVRNLPIDVARKTCADVIIAVPVANPRIAPDKLRSLLAVAGQAMNLAVEANEREQLATLGPNDVVVRVILKDIGSTDFAQSKDAIPIGEAAAQAVSASLARYSLSPAEYAQWRASLVQLATAARPTIDEVRMVGFERSNPEAMRKLLDSQVGETFDPDKAAADASRLVAQRDYTSVTSELVQEGGRNVLVYNAVEKPWGPNYLTFDLNLSTDMKGNTAWGARVNYEKRWLNDRGGELRAGLQVGRPNLAQVEFYQPLAAGSPFFVAPSAYWKQNLEDVYSNGFAIAQVDVKSYGLKLDAGAAIGSSGEFRLGLLRGQSTVITKIGAPVLPDRQEADLGAVTARLAFDTLDQRLFPSSGNFGTFNALMSRTGLGASQDYKLVSGSLGHTFDLGKSVVTAVVRAGSDLNSQAPYYDQFRLGGMFNFSGFPNGSLVGREYAWGGLMFRRRLTYLAESVGSAIYGGLTAELGQVYERFDGTRVSGAMPSGSLFLGIDSKVGPVYIAYGRAQGGHSAFYVYLGSSFEAFRP